MELVQAVDQEFDKENVAPPPPKAGIKAQNHLSGVNQKHSDDDSTDCFVVESSTSEQSARASPLPGIFSSATLAHVEGKEKEEEVTAETEAVSKKKRKKKKKKKKKAKPNEAEAEPEAEAAVSNACKDVDMREGKASGEDVDMQDEKPSEGVSNACEDVDMREKPEPAANAEAEEKSPVAEAEAEMREASAAKAEEEEEDGEIREAEERRNFDVLDDAAVLAVGRRPLIELVTSSDSEPEHRPFYDEEYVTVDEEAPTPLLNAAAEEHEEAEAEEDVSPDPACEHAEPFEEPSEEMMSRIVKQIEFYFSDANILKDYFLLRRVRKTKGGWIRVSLLAGFKLVQSITKDIRQVVFALKRKSTLLETDEPGMRVRRRGGLPLWDHHVYKRTCLVYGFDRHPPRRGRPNAKPQADNVSVQYVREKLFPKFDPRILLVRILKAGKEVPLDLKTCVRNHPQLGQELCVVVEFDTVPTAEAARSSVDGRRWSQSHRLWAKILGKRPRLPEEWAARFGAQRAELLQQQHQQQRDRRADPAYHYHHQQQQAYQQQLLQELYYQQQQQKFLEDLQRRRWGEKKISYADSVRGKKRPAPESYADKVRGAGSKSDTEQPAEAEAEAGASAGAAAATEQRKVAPRVRARAKKSGGTARKAEEKEKEKAPKPKTTSYAAAARSSAEHTKAKDVRRDGATQTAVPEQSERKERTGLQLLREPRGPSEAGSGPAWVRRAGGAVDKDAEVTQRVAETVKSAEAVEKSAEADMHAEAVEKSAEADMHAEAVEKSTEADMHAEAVEKDAEADDVSDLSPDERPGKSSGLARRRSVRELVRQFEALTASPQEEESCSPRRLSMTPRAAATSQDAALDEVPEL